MNKTIMLEALTFNLIQHVLRAYDIPNSLKYEYSPDFYLNINNTLSIYPSSNGGFLLGYNVEVLDKDFFDPQRQPKLFSYDNPNDILEACRLIIKHVGIGKNSKHTKTDNETLSWIIKRI